VTAKLLLDNSAWVRLGAPALPKRRSEEIADALEQRRIAICLPFLLEAGYSARSARDHGDLIDELLALPYFHIDEDVERRAIEAQRQLARAGHLRLPPVDLVLAALAHQHELGVLHYDADYDILAAKTDLKFANVWLAPRGSL
jgi:predicted nucleic acid-binding protein